jgi:hypothetical protein
VLVEDEPAGRPQERRDLVERARKVRDVMERETGDDGVERVGVGELLQRRGAEEVARGRVGVDRHHVVSSFGEGARQVTAATAHLEHSSRRRGEVLSYERVQAHRRDSI